MRSVLSVTALLAGTALAGAAGSWTPPSPGAVYRSMGVLYAAPVQAAVAFVGVGDVTGAGGADFWHSCSRAYTAAYAAGGGNACDLADVGTGAIVCTAKFAANGFVDLTTAYCAGGTQNVPTFCTANTSCVVKKAYDHTAGGKCAGSCDIVQTTLAKMPAFTVSCVSGLPCVTLSSNNVLRTNGSNYSLAIPATMSTLQQVTSNIVQLLFCIASCSGYSSNLTGSNPNTWYFQGAITQSAASGSWHAASANFTAGPTGTFYLDSNGVQTAGVSGIVAGDVILGSGDATGTNAALWFESGLWPSAFNATVSAAVIANQHGSNGCGC